MGVTMSEQDLLRLVRTAQVDRLADVLTLQNVNTHDLSGYSLLHIAARNLNFEAARLLVTRGADVNATDPEKNTPLHYATDRNHLPLAQLLIEAGAEPNPRGRYGMTPLYWAISHPAINWDLVRYLLSHGADPWLQGDNGSSAMDVAVSRYPKFAEELRTQFPRPDTNPV
jgi:ankyrin repeat protein